MATVTTRKLSSDETRWVVRWVVGGGRREPGRKQDSATLERFNDALRFKLDVEEAGHFWPRNWTKDEYGMAVLRDEERPAQRKTFTYVAERYFEHQRGRVAKGRLKSFTVHKYRRIYALHLEPMLGQQDFAAIELEDVEEWMVGLIEAGASPKSIRNWHGVLFSIMAHGQLREKLRRDNPCEASELPERTDGLDKQVRFFYPLEWVAFRRHLAEDVHLMCDLLLASGMRCGELFALQVGDVVVNGPTDCSIHVQRAWTKRDPEDVDRIRTELGETLSWKLSTTKQKRAHWVHVTGKVAEELIEEVAGRDSAAFVFTTASGIPWRYNDFHYDRWLPAKYLAGLDRINPTPHMLRHTFVVWALEAGEDIYRVSLAVGHASVQVTQQIYSGHIDPTRNSVADVIAQQMESLGVDVPVFSVA
jgi:integrase